MDTKKLRQKILDLAIRGKLVPQDPNDEPASVLLERIKTEKERLIKEGKIKRSKKTAKTSDTPHYENVPFEVPSSWEWTTFGSICKKLTDGSHNPPPKRSNGYTVISAQNIKNGKIIFTDKDRYTDEIGFQKENPRTQITKGDIILGIIGGSIGNVAIYDLSDPVVAQRSISIIDTYVLNIYCFYLLQSTIFQSLFLEKSIGNAQAGIYLGELDKLYIPLPPIREQNRIVSEIKRWFTLIDEIEQGKADLQTTIKQIKSKILDLAIHGKLVPQDSNDEPASELLKRINPDFTPCDNAHYTQLPKGWTICRLEQITDYEQPTDYIVESTDYDTSYSTPVLTAGKSFIIGYTNETTGIYSNLPCIIFDDFTTDSKLVNFPFKVKSSAMKILKVNQNIEIDYVAIFMSITRLTGNTHKRYWISEYSKLKIPIPPKTEQKRIVSAVQNIFAKLDMIMENL